MELGYHTGQFRDRTFWSLHSPSLLDSFAQDVKNMGHDATSTLAIRFVTEGRIANRFTFTKIFNTIEQILKKISTCLSN